MSGSLHDELRELHAELGRDKTKAFPVPGYHGRLWVRVRRLDPPRIAELGGQHSDLEFNGPLLAEACEEVYAVRDGKDEPLVGDGPPLRFDVRLAQILGMDVDAGSETLAADIVLGVFQGQRLVLERFVRELYAWMEGEHLEQGRWFQGES